MPVPAPGLLAPLPPAVPPPRPNRRQQPQRRQEASAATVQRSQGSQSGERFSSTNDHPAVTATVPARTSAADRPPRRHHSAAPIPTSAAIYGASAML